MFSVGIENNFGKRLPEHLFEELMVPDLVMIEDGVSSKDPKDIRRISPIKMFSLLPFMQ